MRFSYLFLYWGVTVQLWCKLSFAIVGGYAIRRPHCRALQGTELLCLLHLHVSDAQIELAGIAQSNITKLWG